MDFSTERNEFVAAIKESDKWVNLERLDSEGKFTETVTGGDSCDTLPSFSKTYPQQVLYQSAGIARDEDGYPVAYGPTSINQIDFEQGEMREILADEQYDYLLPRADTAGQLYCIRRPYAPRSHRSYVSALKETLLFPAALLSAILGFLTAFTRLFDQGSSQSKRPNMPQRVENKYVKVLDKTIDLAKIQQSSKSSKEPTLGPGSWELIRISGAREIQVIKKGVSFYELAPDGRVICTNGYRVHRISPEGSQLAFKHKVIQVLKSGG